MSHVAHVCGMSGAAVIKSQEYHPTVRNFRGGWHAPHDYGTVYWYIYIDIDIDICIYIYICIYVHIYLYEYLYTCIFINVCVYVCVLIH